MIYAFRLKPEGRGIRGKLAVVEADDAEEAAASLRSAGYQVSDPDDPDSFEAMGRIMVVDFDAQGPWVREGVG